MKLKIVHQHQETRPGDDQKSKDEELEMKTTEKPQIHVVTEDDPVKERASPLEPTPVSGFQSLVVSGKRKRKPKEVIDEFTPVFRRKKKKKPSSSSRHKNGMRESGGSWMSHGDAGTSIPAQFKSPTVIRAEEVQSSLGNEHPTFLKPLVRSHVSSCFWMGLPVPFCRAFLPSKDATVILENESNEEFPVKYIEQKTGLSAGWRRFVAANKLLEGDVLIFQLTAPCRLKVFVIRANDLNEVDGALSLLNLDSRIKQNETVSERNNHIEEHPGNDVDEVASEVLECTEFSGSSPNFKDVKSLEEFHIVVNGVCIDSDLSEQIQKQYYDLCRSKNAFLHDRLLPGLYRKLASSMIVETVNIAEFIRGCKLTTPKKDFEVWEKSLRSFELLGLNVGFLRARLHHLVKLAFESEGAADVRQYLETQNEQSQIQDEIKNLEAKLGTLKKLSVKYERDAESSQVKIESFKQKFEEAAKAPW